MAIGIDQGSPVDPKPNKRCLFPRNEAARAVTVAPPLYRVYVEAADKDLAKAGLLQYPEHGPSQRHRVLVPRSGIIMGWSLQFNQ